MARIQSEECIREGCDRKPRARDLCAMHYNHAMGIKSVAATPSRNAEAVLRRGGLLTPPKSLPYRALARSCDQCGTLLTTPPHLLTKANGALPRCHTCHIAAVLRSKKKRAAGDPEFKRALRKHSDDIRARVQYQTAEGAHHAREQWTGPELEIASRDDLTARQVALMLGRSYYAVKHARRKLKEDPKWMQVVGLSRHP